MLKSTFDSLRMRKVRKWRHSRGLVTSHATHGAGTSWSNTDASTRCCLIVVCHCCLSLLFVIVVCPQYHCHWLSLLLLLLLFVIVVCPCCYLSLSLLFVIVVCPCCYLSLSLLSNCHCHCHCHCCYCHCCYLSLSLLLSLLSLLSNNDQQPRCPALAKQPTWQLLSND